MRFDSPVGSERSDIRTSRSVGQRHYVTEADSPASLQGIVLHRAESILVAVASPVHGCCDHESIEEYERWDGMS